MTSPRRVTAAGLSQLGGGQHVARQARVKQAAVDRGQALFVRQLVAPSVAPGVAPTMERRLGFNPPTGFGGHDQPDLAEGFQSGENVAVFSELVPHCTELPIDPARLQVVTEDALPPRLGAEAVGVPVPVLDEPGTAGEQQIHHLTQLTGPWDELIGGRADRGGVRLGYQEWSLLHAAGDVGEQLDVRRPRPTDPRRRALRVEVVGPGQLQPVLGRVVDVGADDVERLADHRDVLARLVGGNACGDQVVLRDERPYEVGLPADHVVSDLGLVSAPGQIVGGG